MLPEVGIVAGTFGLIEIEDGAKAENPKPQQPMQLRTLWTLDGFCLGKHPDVRSRDPA